MKRIFKDWPPLVAVVAALVGVFSLTLATAQAADYTAIFDGKNATVTADHDYSGGTLRLPTNAGEPTGTQDEGDAVFDTTGDGLYISQGGGYWTRIGPTGRRLNVNGAFLVDQENGGSAVSPSSWGHLVDMFTAYTTPAAGVISYQQSTSSPPDNSSHFLRATVTTADASIAAGDIYAVVHKVEGYDVGNLGWGTSAAKDITVSFYVRSTLTGTFSGSIRNSSSARSYPFTYTISSASTWERKTITVPGDSSGTWDKTNGVGLQLTFSMGIGSTYQGTAGAWAGAQYWAAPGETAFVSTLSATFDLALVQVEEGSSATDFDWRSYGEELAACQQYFRKIDSNNGYAIFAMLQAHSATQAYGPLLFEPPMRTSPTVAPSTAADFQILKANGAGYTLSGMGFAYSTQSSVRIQAIIGTSALVAGNAVSLYSNSGTDAYITIDSRL